MGLLALLKTSIGKKVSMGVVGVGLMLFLVVHLAGNLLLFVGKDAFNLYAHKLVSNPFIYALEAVLLLAFLLHIVQGVVLTLQSRRARGAPYKSKRKFGRATLFSSTMFLSGSVIFIFLVVHIKSFKYGKVLLYQPEGHAVRDLYTIVVEWFQVPWYSFLYVFAMTLLTAHLIHGSASVPRTLGITSPAILKACRVFGTALSIAIGVGFSSMPMYFLFLHN